MKFIANDLILDSSMGKSYIEGVTKFLLDGKYGVGKIAFTYNQIAPKEIELIFERDTRYEVDSDVLSDEDCVLITGFGLSDFQIDLLGRTHPITRVFPFGSHFYAGIPEMEKIYKQLIKCIDGEKAKVDIIVNDSELTVHIKYR